MSRIQELSSKILQARSDYYNNQPIISDDVFDAWVDELKVLDPENKAIIMIGEESIASEWKLEPLKARKKSLYNARILFKKFDEKSLSKEDLRVHILDFDWKNGLWIDLIWAKYSKDKFIIRVIRDKNNSLHLFDKNNKTHFIKMYLLLIFTKICYFLK